MKLNILAQEQINMIAPYYDEISKYAKPEIVQELGS